MKLLFKRDYELAKLMRGVVELTTRQVTDASEINNEFEVAMRSLRLKYEAAMVDIEWQEALEEKQDE